MTPSRGSRVRRRRRRAASGSPRPSSSARRSASGRVRSGSSSGASSKPPGRRRARRQPVQRRHCAAPRQPARPCASRSNATKMTGTCARIAADGALRPSRAWSARNGSTWPSRYASSSPSRMPSQPQVAGALDDLRELAADVVEVAAVEADLRSGAVQLRADAVVLVLDPDRRTQAAEDLVGVLGRRREHELQRMEQRQLGRPRAGPPRARTAVRPTSPVSIPAHLTRSSGRSKAWAMAASRQPLAQPDAQLAGEHLHDVLRRRAGRHRSQERPEDRALARGPRRRLDRRVRLRDLEERRSAVGRRLRAPAPSARRTPRCPGPTSGRTRRRARRPGRPPPLRRRPRSSPSRGPSPAGRPPGTGAPRGRPLRRGAPPGRASGGRRRGGPSSPRSAWWPRHARRARSSDARRRWYTVPLR